MCLGIVSPFPPSSNDHGLWDEWCTPMDTVSPISLWQEVIPGEEEATDRGELGALQVALSELLAFVSPAWSDQVVYHTILLHPPVWTTHAFFYIINDTLYLCSIIKSNYSTHLYKHLLGAFQMLKENRCVEERWRSNYDFYPQEME